MHSSRRFFVYMLMNRNGTLYTGVTSNLETRLAQHRAGLGGKFTARYGIHRLVWYEDTSSAESAIAYEKTLKGWTRAKKVALIKEKNPHFLDLAAEWSVSVV